MRRAPVEQPFQALLLGNLLQLGGGKSAQPLQIGRPVALWLALQPCPKRMPVGFAHLQRMEQAFHTRWRQPIGLTRAYWAQLALARRDPLRRALNQAHWIDQQQVRMLAHQLGN
jgi:hypothetical protein